LKFYLRIADAATLRKREDLLRGELIAPCLKAFGFVFMPFKGKEPPLGLEPWQAQGAHSLAG